MNSQNNNFWNAILHDVNRSEKLKNNGPLYRKIVTDLIETLRLQFPSESIHVHYFGSRTVGLAGPDSDLDLYVDIGNSSGIYSDNPTKDVIEKGKSITKAIQSKPSTWVYLKNVGGRCPIVIVRHKISNIDCDISFSNSMTCGQNKLVTYIFELQPIGECYQ
ncbi:terminal uridylyltransferase Tailor-like [Drosophila eugracilis]|uniref:terminal uridylyltransferase Tailor-like n=1 Tax=Drosophila eugracilis TaxID=29029 RepID=UPI001BD9DAFA|nr:terminal uridylyltransferase Tailor-like [Drosophila eugracilis]